MSGLARLQRDFQQCLLSGEGNSTLLDAIAGNDAAGPGERAGVYLDAYVLRLAEVLENDFHGLHFAAGDEAFYEMCRDYVRAMPSTQSNARWYGQKLADFLRTAPPWSETPAFADLARLDWAIGVAFDAADAASIGEADIAAVPSESWGDMRLRLSPSVQRLQLAWNAGEVRLARDRQRPCPRLRRHRRPRAWIVSRQNFEVHHRRLDDDEAAALDAVAADMPFAQMCEALCQWHAQDSVPLRAASLLKAWVGNGWITRVLLGP
ncbi:MAG: HvfC/BufC family peptide modification chaperone [Rudaea sp.]